MAACRWAEWQALVRGLLQHDMLCLMTPVLLDSCMTCSADAEQVLPLVTS